LPIVKGAPTTPSGGSAMLENETLGAWSKLTRRSPRRYQFVPSSNAVGAWLAGMVPNRSAAEAGAATIAPAQARDNRSFIGHPRIPASTRDTATL
jgi:hypothetical protein